MRVAVIGLGKLGAPMAAVFASRGHEVAAYDLNQSLAVRLSQGEPTVDEPGLKELLSAAKHRIKPSATLGEAVSGSTIVFVIVPTPSLPDGAFSLEYVQNVLSGIVIEHQPIINIVSTVSPGSMEKLREQLEAGSGKVCGTQFGLVYNPEFIALGSVVYDMLHPPYTLIGEDARWAGDTLEEFYNTIHPWSPVMRMNWASAEVCKLSENIGLTLRISYANMVSELCEKLGASAKRVLKAIGLDPRIGHRYLSSGTAFGGPCFPRDNQAFQAAAVNAGAPAWLAVASLALNQHQTERLAEIVESRTKAGPVGILGLSYKPGTDVTEESAGLSLAKELKKRGIPTYLYDPAAKVENAPGVVCQSITAVVMQCPVVVVTTPWPEFYHLPSIIESMGQNKGSMSVARTVIDCWGVLPDAPANYDLVVLGEG